MDKVTIYKILFPKPPFVVRWFFWIATFFQSTIVFCGTIKLLEFLADGEVGHLLVADLVLISVVIMEDRKWKFRRMYKQWKKSQQELIEHLEQNPEDLARLVEELKRRYNDDT